MAKQLILAEKFTSIQEAQAGLSKLLTKKDSQGAFYRVLRNNKPVGVLLPTQTWEDLLEDIEALTSPRYLNMIKKARREKKTYSLEEVKKILKIP